LTAFLGVKLAGRSVAIEQDALPVDVFSYSSPGAFNGVIFEFFCRNVALFLFPLFSPLSLSLFPSKEGYGYFLSWMASL